MALQRRFLELNRDSELNKLRNPERVKCTLSDCLGICSHGPILTVYPDGIWYHNVDDAALEEIYREHILGGRPVEKYIFHRLYPAGQEPAYAPDLRGDAGSWQAQKAEKVLTSSEATPDTRTTLEQRAQVRRAKKKKGLVIINTGNGKGKTTAALGVMTRAWGRKMRVGVIQFLKNENARFGEIKAAERMGNIDWISTGDGWTWTSQDMDETEARARQAWEVAQERIANGGYDLFIMDEFTYTMHFGWLDANEIVAWLKENKPPMLHLIITGRNAPAALVDYADLVTEMREIKHPFKEQGIRAQAGIEY
ncbi:MAG: cob(I)yrinic acid a,c-diamide adenosyltransferase [Anaerolineae bacterium]|nr:cob(I)yrinic acid a,c-diamide adenosyltransferase [Anaerolineae bacterium]